MPLLQLARIPHNKKTKQQLCEGITLFLQTVKKNTKYINP